MNSGGGLLNDGYAAGRIFRAYGVSTIIEDNAVCASSCAVAFLGGEKRSIRNKGSIMFHAPYFLGRNEYGERDINCNVGQKAFDELIDYYKETTDSEIGERLFERTMWYCSADDGWVVTGSPAAKLFGIATEN